MTGIFVDIARRIENLIISQPLLKIKFDGDLPMNNLLGRSRTGCWWRREGGERTPGMWQLNLTNLANCREMNYSKSFEISNIQLSTNSWFVFLIPPRNFVLNVQKKFFFDQGAPSQFHQFFSWLVTHAAIRVITVFPKRFQFWRS